MCGTGLLLAGVSLRRADGGGLMPKALPKGLWDDDCLLSGTYTFRGCLSARQAYYNFLLSLKNRCLRISVAGQKRLPARVLVRGWRCSLFCPRAFHSLPASCFRSRFRSRACSPRGRKFCGSPVFEFLQRPQGPHFASSASSQRRLCIYFLSSRSLLKSLLCCLVSF